MNKVLLILITTLVVSCGSSAKKTVENELPKNDDIFNYVDKNGEFTVRSTSGYDKKNKTFVTKKSLEIPNRDQNKTLEQSVVISSVGTIKNKKVILRPKISQYNVWFEGKKYTSELKINPAKKAVDLKMTSPETQWNGAKQIKFPSSKILSCFFSQVIDCAKVSGFVTKASQKGAGTMSLLVIWEGYPYLNETFTDFPSELFSNAKLEYDGKTKTGERKFSLNVAGQSIFYLLNDKDVMVKMFWVSQGISMTSKSIKKSMPLPEEDGGDVE